MSDILNCQGVGVGVGVGGSRLSTLSTKLDDEGGGSPPALPPRPPPRPHPRPLHPAAHPVLANALDTHLKRTRVKKYVFLCSVCGGLASLLGTLFLAVYLILRTYTSSLDYFETIPTYIPAAMLMVTGLSVMCLARRRNRYIFLIKLCGLCCLMCVGTCVLVTVTTTVVHMSRLQSLRECVYTLKTQTCTCYSVLLESASERADEGSRYVFNATPDCEAIHGALYSCLRALFGLSVIGILVCIFCCMLVYQLLSHERKKMYWEQLELRCRYLYGQASNPVRSNALVPPAAAAGPPTQHCACCQQFRYQQDILTWEPSDSRFWSGGQVGNLYSPNPVGDDCVLPEPSASGWSWRRLPWSRQAPPNNLRSSNGYHQPLNCSSPDSQYGFSSEPGRVATVSSSTASYTVINPVGASPTPGPYHWGPPPPYSDPNSPSRPVLCPPGPHHHHCQQRAAYSNNAAAEQGHSAVDDESCRVLQLRLPSRRADLPSSSASSLKSNSAYTQHSIETVTEQRISQRQEIKPILRNEGDECLDCGVSPRIKYLNSKLQNTSENPPRKRTQELSESEVYFADVSSCNVSVRNDSMSIYGEALDNKPERSTPNKEDLQQNDELKKKPYRSSSGEGKGPCFQVMRTSKEITRPDKVLSHKDNLSFQRIQNSGEFPFPTSAFDNSEEDDPELVKFSQRQTSLRSRMPHYRNENSNKLKGSSEQDPNSKSQNEIPSPMSISSPSTVSKDNTGFYAEVVNSDNGSSDSVWSGYSPDLLAPDAQYEVIPEHRITSLEDLNGNPNESNESHSRLKMYFAGKKRQHPQVISENWPLNGLISGENQEFPDKQKCSVQNMNSHKNSDRSKELHKTARSSDRCLADILNSPKPNNKNTRQGHFSNSHQVQSFHERRRSANSPTESNVGNIYYSISENDNICFDRMTNDIVFKENPESLTSQDLPDHEALTASPKVMERIKLSKPTFVKSLEPCEIRECFHSDNSCKCFNTELPNSEPCQVQPVDV